MTEFGSGYRFSEEDAGAVAEVILSKYPGTVFFKPSQADTSGPPAGKFVKFLQEERSWVTPWKPERPRNTTYKITVSDSEREEFLDFMEGLASEEFLENRRESLERVRNLFFGGGSA